MFTRSRRSNINIYIISPDHYEIPRSTFSANGKIYHIFKPNNFRDVQNRNQEKTALGITSNEFKLLTTTCWNERYQHVGFDRQKSKIQDYTF